MNEKPEALEVADSVEFCPQPYAYAAARLLREQHAEIERLKAALPYDWNMLEACRGSLREHMAEINRLKAERDEAVKAEREACAKVCEVGVDYPHPIVKGVVVKDFGGSKLLAKAIRARGEVPR